MKDEKGPGSDKDKTITKKNILQSPSFHHFRQSLDNHISLSAYVI
jgi:hypothetical protein